MRQTRILRGRLEDNEERRLIVDDGNFKDGWRVVNFVVAGNGTTSAEVSAKLAVREVPTLGWNWGDSREIAWASSRQTVEAAWGGFPNAIDKNNVIVMDLWIYATASNGSDVNYMIEIERVALDDNQSVLALIQERAQDDL